MKINNLTNSRFNEASKKISKKTECLNKLINALNKREVPSNIVDQFNEKINSLNTFSESNSKYLKLQRKTHYNILSLIEKELKVVPKNFYRDRWIGIGMAVFGVAFGAAFGAALGNMAFIGIGIPIGMAIGIAIGTAKDKAAKEAGLQLDLENEF